MAYKRLEGILALIPDEGGVADIGTDHGYLPIMLLKRDRSIGIERTVIASDVASGPLGATMRSFAREGLADRISVRQGYGLECVQRDDGIETFVIAGMGGHTIINIINHSLSRASSPLIQGTHMILQANNDCSELRKWIRQKGFLIFDQFIVAERGKFYRIDLVEYNPGCDTGITGRESIDEKIDRYIGQGLPEELVWEYGVYTLLRHDQSYIDMLHWERSKLIYAKNMVVDRNRGSAGVDTKIQSLDERIHRLDVVLGCIQAGSR